MEHPSSTTIRCETFERHTGILCHVLASISRKRVNVKENAPPFLYAREQSGTEFDEEFTGAAIGIDGSVVMSGYTFGNWSATQAGGDDDMDFVAMSMDIDGNILWEYQVGNKSVIRQYILDAASLTHIRFMWAQQFRSYIN